MHRHTTVLVALAFLLAACSRAGDGSALPELTPQPSGADAAVQLPDGPLDGAAIHSVLVGRTWNYENADFRGTITFNADGTIDYNQSGAGRGTGRWHVVDGKLCESFDPGPAIPKGRKDMCFPFRHVGGNFYVSSTKLTPAS